MKNITIILLLLVSGMTLAKSYSNESFESKRTIVLLHNDKKPKKKGTGTKTSPKKETDSVGVDMTALKSQVDSILVLMNTKVVPYVDAQSATANAEQAAKIKSLTDEIATLKTQRSAENKILDDKIQEYNNCESKQSLLNQQIKDNANVMDLLKTQLKLEVDALAKQSYTIDLAFITSLEEQLKSIPGADKNWATTVSNFKAKRNLLIEASDALMRPYDAKVPGILKNLKDGFATGQQFVELTKAKDKFVKLLEKYCEKTDDLKSLLVDANTLNGLKTQRDILLESDLYRYVEYEYLVQIILKNKVEFTYNPIKNVVTNCQ
jgi:hypothetical protein